MGGQDNDHADKASLEQQMKNLISRIAQEPVPNELRTLAEELQAALRRHRESSDPHE
ncbi:hypothetical protein [Roseinatronobacter alkalisoli]|uniref:Anti-sigma factor NepR domain-containing protein n=1 Tax=Roseinatronobacter alkalisoli TaxID=3028235 RepID=A0ABT5T814_9RHOB|nr:hypothetical protein [Roseinatronobacter sp. HJB301]MDD7971089.1 hypothetical protein [Roseinatronobacter sp. HJB301]